MHKILPQSSLGPSTLNFGAVYFLTPVYFSYKNQNKILFYYNLTKLATVRNNCFWKSLPLNKLTCIFHVNIYSCFSTVQTRWNFYYRHIYWITNFMEMFRSPGNQPIHRHVCTDLQRSMWCPGWAPRSTANCKLFELQQFSISWWQ